MLLLNLNVQFDEVEETFRSVSSYSRISNFLRDVKDRFGIERSIACSLELNGVKLKSTQPLCDQSVKDGAQLTLVSTGKAWYRKKLTSEDKVIFKGDETKKFETAKTAIITEFLNTKIKPDFKIDSVLHCYLTLNDENLQWNKTLEASGVVNTSILTLHIKEKQPEKPEAEKVEIDGMNLNVVPIPSRLVEMPKVAVLYVICDKIPKVDRQNHQKPLSLVRYVGTITTTTVEKRFEKHCEKKTANYHRFVFNPTEHCIVQIMVFDSATLDRRFDSAEQAVFAYELLAGRLRKEFNLVAHWIPGSGSKSTNAAAISKLNDDDLAILARHLVSAIRTFD